VQLGVSFGRMFRETFFRPMFLLLVLCMMMTASVELGPNTWLTPVLESAGIPGILVLVWISLLMALARQFAGPMVRRLAPTGILLCSAVLSGLGLVALSYAHSLIAALAAGTVFAAGVSYFWPTMIGVTSERVPKGGPLALAMMGAAGMFAVGLITTPMMGWVADSQVHGHLPVEPTTACLGQIVETYPALLSRTKGKSRDDIRETIEAVKAVLAAEAADKRLPEPRTVETLRLAIASAPESKAAQSAKQLLGPAENFGGRIAFRWVAVLSAALVVLFGSLYLRDRICGVPTDRESAA
jgi:hypothetical protein